MNSNAITYLASGILGVAFGVATLVAGGGVNDGDGIACVRADDCHGQEQVVPCPGGVRDCAAPEAVDVVCNRPNCGRSEEITVACDRPDCGRTEEMLMACDTEDCPVQSDDGVLLADDGRAGGVDDRVVPCDPTDPGCDNRSEEGANA